MFILDVNNKATYSYLNSGCQLDFGKKKFFLKDSIFKKKGVLQQKRFWGGGEMDKFSMPDKR